MLDPSGNQLVLFPSSPNVSLNFVSGNIRTLEKTRLAYHLTENSAWCVESIMVSDLPVYRRIVTS